MVTGNAHIVWGTDGGSETETATITNNENQIVGQVCVDNKNNTVSVTKFDVKTGKPDVDPATGKPVSSTFHYDAEGNLVNDGNLSSEDRAHVPLDDFHDIRNQFVTLQDGTANTLPISVDIAPNLTSASGHSLTAMITMPAKPSSNPDHKIDMLLMEPGGVEGTNADPKQLIAQFMPEASDNKTTTYVSPMPTPAPTPAPAPSGDKGLLHDWFSWL